MKTTFIYKQSKRALIALTLVIGFSLSVNAQEFSGGVDLGVPIGNLSDVGSIGIGLSVKYESSIPSVENLNWTGSLGYTAFLNKTIYSNADGSAKTSASIIPLLGGVKYYLNSRYEGFYVSGEIGLGFGSYKSKYTGSAGQGLDGTYSASTTRFGFAPGAGYRYKQFDFAAKINLMSDFTYFGLHAAYVWPMATK